MKRFVSLTLAFAAPVTAKAGDWQIHRVEIDGARYTVRDHLADNTAMVFFKSPKRMSAALYVEMKCAFEQAAGCKATDGFARGAILDVLSDCSNVTTKGV